MFPWSKPKACPTCQEKENRLQDLVSQILTLKGQLSHSREREEKAIDALLGKQGVESITPKPRLTQKDVEAQQKEAFAIFTDEHDNGDGTILEADQLNVHRSPL